QLKKSARAQPPSPANYHSLRSGFRQAREATSNQRGPDLSEGNILIRYLRALSDALLRAALVESARRGATGAVAAASAGKLIAGRLTPAAQQHHVIDDDLGAVLLLTGFLVVPGIGAQPAFDIDLAAFLQVLAGDLSGALPGGDVVPLSAVLPVAVLVFEPLIGGQGELGHGRALGGVLDFGIFAEVTDEDDLIDALHGGGSWPSGALRNGLPGFQTNIAEGQGR